MSRPRCPNPDALKAAEVTNHWRYCELCDPLHPDYVPGCAAHVAGLVKAMGRAPGKPGRVKAGFLSPCALFGGGETHQIVTAKATDPDRVEWVGSVVTNGRGAAAPAVVAAIEEVMPVGFGEEAAVDLARRCDVLVVWAVERLGAILAASGNAPYVFSVCHVPGENPHAATTYLNTDGVDRFVAVSALSVGPIPAGRFREGAVVVENAVDSERLRVTVSRDEQRRRWGVPADAYAVGWLGRMVDEKRPLVLAAATAHLPTDCHVVMVGDGRLRPRVVAASGESGGRLHAPAADPGIGNVLNAFDVVVCPHEYESFCLVMAEAMTAGVPLIATPVGVNKLYPGHARDLPQPPTPEDVARAVLLDRGDKAGTAARVAGAKEFAARWNQEAFGRTMTDLIVNARRPVATPEVAVATPKVATPRPAASPVRPYDRDLYNAVLRCPYRKKPGCGCGGHACAAGKGTGPDGLVTLATCYDCVGDGGPL